MNQIWFQTGLYHYLSKNVDLKSDLAVIIALISVSIAVIYKLPLKFVLITVHLSPVYLYFTFTEQCLFCFNPFHATHKMPRLIELTVTGKFVEETSPAISQ
jgi:hypothetical protein